MTMKERERLIQDLRYWILCLAPGIPPNEIRLEVDHGIMPIIDKLLDKVVARALKQEIELADGKGVWQRNEQA